MIHLHRSYVLAADIPPPAPPNPPRHPTPPHPDITRRYKANISNWFRRPKLPQIPISPRRIVVRTRYPTQNQSQNGQYKLTKPT